MKRILKLCPYLKRLTASERIESIKRMHAAHVMNGGEYIGFYATAVAYLESI